MYLVQWHFYIHRLPVFWKLKNREALINTVKMGFLGQLKLLPKETRDVNAFQDKWELAFLKKCNRAVCAWGLVIPVSLSPLAMGCWYGLMIHPGYTWDVWISEDSKPGEALIGMSAAWKISLSAAEVFPIKIARGAKYWVTTKYLLHLNLQHILSSKKYGTLLCMAVKLSCRL